MEQNSTEVLVVEKAVAQALEVQVTELRDLHLAMVGGGIGETIL